MYKVCFDVVETKRKASDVDVRNELIKHQFATFRLRNKVKHLKNLHIGILVSVHVLLPYSLILLGVGVDSQNSIY